MDYRFNYVEVLLPFNIKNCHDTIKDINEIVSKYKVKTKYKVCDDRNSWVPHEIRRQYTNNNEYYGYRITWSRCLVCKGNCANHVWLKMLSKLKVNFLVLSCVLP